jgi:hypothetical protein
MQGEAALVGEQAPDTPAQEVAGREVGGNTYEKKGVYRLSQCCGGHQDTDHQADRSDRKKHDAVPTENFTFSFNVVVDLAGHHHRQVPLHCLRYDFQVLPTRATIVHIITIFSCAMRAEHDFTSRLFTTIFMVREFLSATIAVAPNV